MPGGYDKHERLIPDEVAPRGAVTYQERPVPVRAILRLLRPTLEQQVDALALAWTQNAVWVLYHEPEGENSGGWRTRWVRPEDVARRHPLPPRP